MALLCKYDSNSALAISLKAASIFIFYLDETSKDNEILFYKINLFIDYRLISLLYYISDLLLVTIY